MKGSLSLNSVVAISLFAERKKREKTCELIGQVQESRPVVLCVRMKMNCENRNNITMSITRAPRILLQKRFFNVDYYGSSRPRLY